MSLAEILEEIHKLSREEQAELLVRLNAEAQENDAEPFEHYLDHEQALATGRAYMIRHSELFRKLAQ